MKVALQLSVLILTTCFTKGNHSAFKQIVLHKLACAKTEQISSDILYFTTSTKEECFQLMVENNFSMAMTLEPNVHKDEFVSCGFLPEVPITTSCSDKKAGGTVYSSEHLMPCPAQCDFYFHLLSVRYCAHQSMHRLNYSQCDDYCKSLGGRLAEAETSDHLQAFSAHLSQGESLFVGSQISKPGDIFKWNRGDIVLDRLWVEGQPDNHHGDENCVRLKKQPTGISGLRDTSCHLEFPALCAFRCYEG